MQGWRVTCRACSGAIADVWSDVNRAKFTAFDQFEDEARAGEETVESYAEKHQSFPVSPATMLRLLLLRRRPTPQEVRDQPELPRRLIGTVIPDFDTIADDHGLNTAIGRSAVLPTIIRLRLLAGLAVVMNNPLEHLSLLRQSRAFGPQFDRVLAQDPIVTPNTLPQSQSTTAVSHLKMSADSVGGRTTAGGQEHVGEKARSQSNGTLKTFKDHGIWRPATAGADEVAASGG
jgi:hypothetical protein